jgi:methionyl-tRNA formyltransferase
MPQNNKPKIIFFGTPEFAAKILEALLSADYAIKAVVAQPDKAVGRHQTLTHPPTKVLALKNKIKVLQPANLKDPDFLADLKKLKPDLIITAAYGKIIPKEILELPKFGAINVHGSLLPKFRGASPIQYAIWQGEAEAGVTIMLMDEIMDHGPIVAEEAIRIAPDDTSGTLHGKLADLGANLLIKTLPKWLNRELEPQDQDMTQVTYTKILKRDDGRINWSKPAIEIERQIRAFTPWPGVFTEIDGKRLKIIKAKIANESGSKNAGEVLKTSSGELAVVCGESSLILEKVQLEGKKEVSGKEFLNGYGEIIGKILK